jgi:hypothetical protein
MKALTWKAVFASLNPSPVFEVVAMVAEGLAMNADESRSKETEGADDSSAARGRRASHASPNNRPAAGTPAAAGHAVDEQLLGS